ncbi:hypothetical protein GP486_006427 [Trichoglossum hirsutum]|uniref:26S proteasome regulatory subunit 6A n=1 Tax=Trichoglossum hirsutum TaxID=265104 RepID=A0A9P8IGY0_9PEZI|nr:hypothetical protein GP486_006427 [Trichoglossum hirsutum]
MLEAIVEDGPAFNIDCDDEPALCNLSRNCHGILEDLQELKQHFDSVGTQTQVTWEREQWRAEELAEIRSRLTATTSSLNTVYSKLIHSSTRMIIEKLNTFIDEVRTGKREGSVVTNRTTSSLSAGEKEAWRQLRKELESVGITPALFNQHRELIIERLLKAISDGDLVEDTGEELSDTTSEPTEECLDTADPIYRHGGSAKEPGEELSDRTRGSTKVLLAAADPTYRTTPKAGIRRTKTSPAEPPASRPIKGPSRIAKLLFRVTHSSNSIIDAVQKGNKGLVQELLQRGANPDPRDRTYFQLRLLNLILNSGVLSILQSLQQSLRLRKMSTLEDLEDLEREGEQNGDKKPDQNGDAEMKDAESTDKKADEDLIDPEILHASTQDINGRRRLLENELRIMKAEHNRLTHEKSAMQEKTKENMDKIENNRQLPYLVGNVVELLDMDPTAEAAEEGANIDLDATRVGKSAVIKTSTRQTIFLPIIGLVDADKLKPADLIGLNKDSYLVLDTLPAEYDSRVKAMEVDEKPTEKYTDVGGLDKQIEELVEAVVMPMKEADRFKKIGIKPPKGALMYGPPGTGKTLLARACAAQTDATFLKLAGPQLVQMFIGDGAKLVRDAFALAKEKAPAIIFIDELDAVGTKRFDSEKSGDREVQRTMLELLNQLDGFASDDRVKVLAATNRVDVLDPALLRSGRLDRKIEFPLPNEEARAQIMRIHSRKMTVDDAVNWMELARSTDEFGGAQLKAVCVEAGMIALRAGHVKISHEHYVDAIAEVQSKRKETVNFYA